jgi:hypothetical protein
MYRQKFSKSVLTIVRIYLQFATRSLVIVRLKWIKFQILLSGHMLITSLVTEILNLCVRVLPMTFKIKSYETLIILCEYEIWSVT